jgi:hypothetical protein
MITRAAGADSENARFVSDEVVDRFCLVGQSKFIGSSNLAEVGVTQFNIYLMCEDERGDPQVLQAGRVTCFSRRN